MCAGQEIRGGVLLLVKARCKASWSLKRRQSEALGKEGFYCEAATVDSENVLGWEGNNRFR